MSTRCMHGFRTENCDICNLQRRSDRCDFGVCRRKAAMTLTLRSSDGAELDRRPCCHMHRVTMRQTFGAADGQVVSESTV